MKHFKVKKSCEKNSAHYFIKHKNSVIAQAFLVGDALEDLWVHPDYRRKGLATELMSELMKDSSDIPINLLPVDEERIGIDIFGFYAKFGFVINETGSMDYEPQRCKI